MNNIYRKELKYIISEDKYLNIKNMMDVVMEPDRHGENGRYMVRSQYYDSLTDCDLHDNLDGVYDKKKIRIRIYSPDAENGKLEYKCKYGSDGIKHSLTLSREEIGKMENGQYDFLLERDEELARHLYIKINKYKYSPKTIIEYDRTAYMYPISDLRITYDRNIRATINPYGILEKEPMYIPLMTPDKGILEIKYNDFFPAALRPLVSVLDNAAEAYSKYSQSRLKFL